MSRVVHIDDDNIRIDEARAAFWDRSEIRLYIKLKVYRSGVFPTLIYACEKINSLSTACQKTEPLPYMLP